MALGQFFIFLLILRFFLSASSHQCSHNFPQAKERINVWNTWGVQVLRSPNLLFIQKNYSPQEAENAVISQRNHPVDIHIFHNAHATIAWPQQTLLSETLELERITYILPVFTLKERAAVRTHGVLCMSEDSHNTTKLFPRFVMDMRCVYSTVRTESWLKG